MKDESGNTMLMKLKDWPPDNDFAKALPEHFEDLMRCIPLKVRPRKKCIFSFSCFLASWDIR